MSKASELAIQLLIIKMSTNVLNMNNDATEIKILNSLMLSSYELQHRAHQTSMCRYSKKRLFSGCAYDELKEHAQS